MKHRQTSRDYSQYIIGLTAVKNNTPFRHDVSVKIVAVSIPVRRRIRRKIIGIRINVYKIHFSFSRIVIFRYVQPFSHVLDADDLMHLIRSGIGIDIIFHLISRIGVQQFFSGDLISIDEPIRHTLFVNILERIK